MVFLRLLSPFIVFAALALPKAEAYSLASQADRLALAVQERSNSQFPNQVDYEKIWKLKCGKPTDFPIKKCLLTENDVFGEKGRKDHVILFRGEKENYTYPSTSSFLRYVMNGETEFCDARCDVEQLIKILKFDLNSVIKEKIKLDPTDKTINYLLTGHVSSDEQYALKKKDGQSARFDAMVSYSYSPVIAGGFAYGGRVIVTSVVQSRIKTCANYEMTAEELIDSSSCKFYLGREENYENELEVDYLILTNPDDVFDVYQHKNKN
jgi:hypothetical protein